MATASVNGIELGFDDEGAGDPVLLLHPFALSRSVWAPQLSALTGRCRVIAVDLPGHGQSDRLGNPHLARWSDQVASLLEQLRVRQAVAVGLSMGGYVALALARRHPGLVRALVLANTRAARDSDEAKAGREQTALQIEAEGMGPVAAGLGPRLLAPDAPEVLRAQVDRWLRAANPGGAADASRAMARRDDATTFVSRWTKPLLVISGSADQAVPAADTEAMARSCAVARFELIAGAGHLTPIEAPDRFNALVGGFIDGLTG
jgi:pimeloyl-ACP methyl ester carboxylesterase